MSEGARTIKVFGRYSVELDGKGVVVKTPTETIKFYPDDSGEAQDLASVASAMKRRMLQRAHALKTEADSK